MKKSICILDSVHDLFEQKLGELSAYYLFNPPFNIVEIISGWYFYVRRLPVRIYIIEFYSEESMNEFSEWVLSNGF